MASSASGSRIKKAYKGKICTLASFHNGRRGGHPTEETGQSGLHSYKIVVSTGKICSKIVLYGGMQAEVAFKESHSAPATRQVGGLVMTA